MPAEGGEQKTLRGRGRPGEAIRAFEHPVTWAHIADVPAECLCPRAAQNGLQVLKFVWAACPAHYMI